ncbi:MAG: cardiolipin synthase [Clostridiales bacterium]|nr:cardiolipin synthase [Clostridiales bacterium]
MNRKSRSLLNKHRVLVCILLALQIALSILIIAGAGFVFYCLGIAFALISIIIALCVAGTKFQAEYRIAWIALILILPLFGSIVYLIYWLQAKSNKFGKAFMEANKKGKTQLQTNNKLSENIALSNKAYFPHVNYLEKSAGFPLYENTANKYLKIGEEFYASLLQELAKAKKYIFIEFYAIKEGKMWDGVLQILEQKASEHVDVRIIYDDLGSFSLFKADYIVQLHSKHIKTVAFNPLRPILTTVQSCRNHRKSVVIDGIVAYTGGINIADEYINEHEIHGHWKDTAIMISGDGAWCMSVIFLSLWSFCTSEAVDYRSFEPIGDLLNAYSTNGYVQPYYDNPFDDERVAESAYLNIIQRAKNYLYIHTPYLIIGDTLLFALSLAAKSGIDVRIVTPHADDVRFMRMATRSYYRRLVEAGVKIYEYAPGFMHSKLMISDDNIAVIGSVNLDYRSLNLQLECGIMLYESSEIQNMKSDYLNSLDLCNKITKDICETSAFVRFLQGIIRIFSPIL